MSFRIQDNGLIVVEAAALTLDDALTFAQELATAAWQAKGAAYSDTLRLVTERSADAMREIYGEIYVHGGPVR